MVLDPCYAPGYRNFDVCLLLSCALESSYLGRLSAIKVQLELELTGSEIHQNKTLQFDQNLRKKTRKKFKIFLDLGYISNILSVRFKLFIKCQY